jgi:hypothetical protein
VCGDVQSKIGRQSGPCIFGGPVIERGLGPEAEHDLIAIIGDPSFLWAEAH